MEKKIKILIAEDDDDERECIQNGFLDSGLFEVMGAVQNGHEIIKTLKETSSDLWPDIVLSDLVMPVANGYEALKEIKSDPKFASVKFIIFSSNSNIIKVDALEKAGVYLFLAKPSSFFSYKDFAVAMYMELQSIL